MTTSVLVTGGAGYIGSHACKALAARGYRPIAYDNMSFGHREAVRWGPLVVADVADRAQLDRTIKEYGVTAVMHFAGSAFVAESIERPLHYFRNNVANMVTLLEAMQAAEIRHIVFSSSCATYGVPQQVPIAEDAPQRPINPYGESKLMVEHMLRWTSSANRLTFAILRYFNAAGGDPEGLIGEDHTPETHLIPLILDAALDRRSHISVFGTDYPTPDGTAVRDYIHVTDLADAHVQALDHLGKGGPSLTLNLGTGHGHSVREVITAVERLVGKPVPFRDSPRRPGDPPVLVADPTRSREVLGFHPQRSDLDTILKTALAFKQKGFPAA